MTDKLLRAPCERMILRGVLGLKLEKQALFDKIEVNNIRGDIMVTIKDIAKECNVSIATVSNVINGKKKAGPETQDKIFEAVNRLGYKTNKVAKGLRSRKTGTIGIIVEDLSQFTVPNIVEGITRHLETVGYKPVLVNLRLYSRWADKWFNNEDMISETMEQTLDELTSIMVDGIIYIAVHARDTEKIPADLSIPAVMVYALEQNPNVPSVVIDDEQSAYEEVCYLIEKGHKDIGIIGGREDNMHTRLRLKGALRALSEHGIEQRADRVCYALWGKKEGYEAAQMLADKGVTAFFVMADRMAGGVYEYAKDHGIAIGKDWSVVGFDDQILADYLMPGLTTMALPLHPLGDAAAKLLVSKMESSECDISLTDNICRIPCIFRERGSVADLTK